MTRTLPLIAAALLLLAAACTKDSKSGDESSTDTVGTAASSDTAKSAAAAPAEGAPDEMRAARRLSEHPVGEVEVEQLAAMIDDGACAVFDANTDSTRKKLGLIPTATALSHYSKYAASELPASTDTKLVFYCASESCRASDTAAEKAVLAGYDDVNVLPAGIRGWRDAKKETKTYQN